MPRKEGQRNLSVPMSDEEIQQVHQMARRRGYKVTSDYIRQLIQADATTHGETIAFEVDRGGYRGDKAE